MKKNSDKALDDIAGEASSTYETVEIKELKEIQSILETEKVIQEDREDTKHIFKLIYSQIMDISDLVQKNDVWLYTIYKMAIDNIYTNLRFHKITDDTLEEFRQLLHLCNSSIANMSQHGADEEDIIKDTKLFTYLYSVHDLLKDLIMYNTDE
jgi:hypothetical protein